MLPVTWLRYLLRKPKTWTVEVGTQRLLRAEPIFEEQYPTRTEAARRADEIANAIVSGTLIGPADKRHDAADPE
jgi:hypothetical protein